MKKEETSEREPSYAKKEAEQFTFDYEPIRGYPELRWTGKRPFRGTSYFPAQLKESHGDTVDGWRNKLYWGDNLQVMSHLLREYRGQVKLIYIDPPFDSKADYKKKIELRGQSAMSDASAFEEKQYTDIWTNDEYLQFMYERLILMRELLAEDGAIYLHCDYGKAHHIKCLLDEVFGPNNWLNSLVWAFQTRSSIKKTWKRTHNDIFFYKKNLDPVFNWNHEMVLEPLSENTIKKYKYEDENGRYRLSGRNIIGSPIRSAKDVDQNWEKTHPEWVVRDYLRDGKSASDYFFIDIENQASSIRTDYPTQKPEELLFKLLCASTNPGDLVFDCFMGSGTTQAVAMKLGRRFLGADINLCAIQTTTKRLLGVADELKQAPKELGLGSDDKPAKFYPGFEVYTVNNYDFFRNELEAKELLIEALELQKLPGNMLWDGESDGWMVKILAVNRLATAADINPIIANLDYKAWEKRAKANPGKSVERIRFVCMGHDPDLRAQFLEEMDKLGFKVDLEILDILRDRKELQFKRESEARITLTKKKLEVKKFYPMNLLQKLSLEKTKVEDWRELVDSVLIDWNYDGAVFSPGLIDIPEKGELVSGVYDRPEDSGIIRVKITDLIAESWEGNVGD